MSTGIVYRAGRKVREEFASSDFYDNTTSGLAGDSVQEALDEIIAGGFATGLVYKGGYNATTNVPDLDTAPVGVKAGDVYVVTAAGTAFYTATLEVGDMLFAESDAPVLETSWTVLQANLTAATIKTQYESNADTNAYTDAAVTQNSLIELYIPVGDETTDQTAAADKASLRAPVAFALTGVKIGLATAATTTPFVVDVHKGGVTVLTEKVHIDAAGTTSVGSSANASKATVQITAGTGGELSTLLVDGVDLLSAAVPFNASINQTATDIAANIQANTSVPNYNAAAVTDTITITAAVVGSAANGLTPTPTWTSDLASTDVNFGAVVGQGLGLFADYTIDPAGGVADFAADDLITVDVDQIGSGNAGKGLKVWLLGTRA